MPQQTSSHSDGGQNPQAFAQLSSLALRTLGQACEFQWSAGRAILQTQARAACAAGWPDWTPLLDAVDEPARRVVSAGAEQWLAAAQRTSEIASRLQQQVGQMVSLQAGHVADAVEQGMQQFGEQAAHGLDQLADTAEQQAEVIERSTAAAEEELRRNLSKGARQRGNGRSAEQAGGASQDTASG